jgi:hypothetical protein
MFEDLINAWKEMTSEYSHIIDRRGTHISFPEPLFSKFEQIFNLHFVPLEEDITFKSWRQHNMEYEDD